MSSTLAWIIVANKPFYPMYVWWLVGSDAVGIAALTAISAPFYAALPFLARRNSLWTRAGVPTPGTLDTLLAVWIFGKDSGTALFFAPCALLGVVFSRPGEPAWGRALVAAIYVLVTIGCWIDIEPLRFWDATSVARLVNLNILSATALMALVAWRFAGAPRSPRENSAKTPRERVSRGRCNGGDEGSPYHVGGGHDA